MLMKPRINSVVLSLLMATAFLSFPQKAYSFEVQYFDSEDAYRANTGSSAISNSGVSNSNNGTSFDSSTTGTGGYSDHDYESNPYLVSPSQANPQTFQYSLEPLTTIIEPNQHKYDRYIDKTVHVYVNGVKCEVSNVPIMMIDGRVFVPINFIGYYMGFSTSWFEDELTAEINDGALIVEVGSYTMYKYDGFTYPTDVPPFLYMGTVMIPLRQVASALNYSIIWDNASRTAYLERATPHNLYQSNVFDRTDY